MTDPEDPIALLEEIVAAVGHDEPVVLATVVETTRATPTHGGARMLVYGDGRSSGTIGGGPVEASVASDALDVLASGEAKLARYDLAELGMCPGELTVYLEPQVSRSTVLVIGCGHVGRAVAELAHWLGFRVVALDDRPALATSELLPDADEIVVGPMDEMLRSLEVTRRTHVVLATRSTELDVEVLPLLLAMPAASIGVLGGRHRWSRTKGALLAAGCASDDLERIKSPVGLDLGARTPREIALSVLAEIIVMHRAAEPERTA